MMTSEVNPFANIRETLRSEEDDIRRGVFSHVLRNLMTATAQQKQEWQTEIEETQRIFRERVAGGKARASEKTAKEKASSTPEEAPAADAAAAAAAARITTREGEKEENRTSGSEVAPVASPLLGMKRDRSEGQEAAGGVSSNLPKKEDAASSTSTSDGEGGFSIGSFLHSQVEKTVGGTLNTLSSGILRILCMILGLAPKSRSKETLYSMLATYHYTHCEVLGKRVSRSTFVDDLAKQDVKSLHLFIKHPVKGAGKTDRKEVPPQLGVPKKEAPTPVLTRTKQTRKPSHTSVATGFLAATAHCGKSTGAEVSKSSAGKNATTVAPQKKAAATATLRAVSKAIPSSSLPPTPQTSAGAHYSTQEQQQQDSYGGITNHSPFYPSGNSTTSDLSISYPEPVLRRPTATADPLHSSSSTLLGRRSTHGAQEENSEWTTQNLEKRIATIVRNFDPVTTTIVIKKLAKMGFTSPTAKQVVESVLQSFHQKKYIYFESGIAYCLD